MTKRDRKTYLRAYRAANIEKLRAYAVANHDKIQARRRAYVALKGDELRAKARARYAARREHYVAKQRAYNANHRRSVCHGLTPNEVLQRLAAQGGKCACCGSTKSGSIRRWHGDHDHKSGRFRAVLCAGCNSGMGHFRDDPLRLRAAAAYLERHEQLQALL